MRPRKGGGRRGRKTQSTQRREKSRSSSRSAAAGAEVAAAPDGGQRSAVPARGEGSGAEPGAAQPAPRGGTRLLAEVAPVWRRPAAGAAVAGGGPAAGLRAQPCPQPCPPPRSGCDGAADSEREAESGCAAAAPGESGDFLSGRGRRGRAGAGSRRRCRPRPQVGRRWRGGPGGKGRRDDGGRTGRAARCAPPLQARVHLRSRRLPTPPVEGRLRPAPLRAPLHTHAAAGGGTGNTGCSPVLRAAESPRRGHPGRLAPPGFSQPVPSPERGPASPELPVVEGRARLAGPSRSFLLELLQGCAVTQPCVCAFLLITSTFCQELGIIAHLNFSNCKTSEKLLNHGAVFTHASESAFSCLLSQKSCGELPPALLVWSHHHSQLKHPRLAEGRAASFPGQNTASLCKCYQCCS